MAKLLVMYNRPADPAAFDQYYFKTHVPIFRPTPGLRAVSFSQGPVQAPVGEADYYLITELVFDSMADLQTALASEPLKKAVGDIPNFTSAGVTILAYDTHD